MIISPIGAFIQHIGSKTDKKHTYIRNRKATNDY